MGPDDVPQPDLFLKILPEYGGQSSPVGDYAKMTPELIVEVSGSSLSRDLSVRLDLYRRAGVREYLTVQLRPRQIIWRRLSRGRYREVAPDADGLLRLRYFPGLWLNFAALRNAKRSMRKAVELGTQSPEHAALVRRLAAQKRK